MTPAIFINCHTEPFVNDILSCLKQYETRTRNTLGRFLGDRVLLVETGHGCPMVKGSAVIDEVVEVRSKAKWDDFLELTWIPVGSKYDWQPTTKVKWLYHLSDVRPCDPFPLPSSCRRHGRVWAEYEEAHSHGELTHVTYEHTGGGVYCYSALYRGRYWVFGSTSDVMSAYTIDPLHADDETEWWIDESGYRITDATDFPTWREVLESITPDVVGDDTYAIEQARMDIPSYKYELPVTEYGIAPGDE